MNMTARIARSTLGICLLLASVDLQAQETIEQLLNRLANPTLGAAGSVNDHKMTIGSLQLHLASGTVAEVKAGEEVIGIFFNGRGTYDYTSTTAGEFPTMSFNTKRGTKLEAKATDGKLRISDTFERAYIRTTARGSLPALTGGSNGPLSEPFRQHVERMKRVERPPVVQRLVVQRLDHPSKTFAIVELAGGKEEVIYTLDEVVDRAERLEKTYGWSKNVAARLSDYLFTTTLSEQPIGHSCRETQLPVARLRDVKLDISASAKDDASLVAHETYSLERGPARALILSQNSWRLSEIDREPRRYHVRKISSADGKTLPHHHENGSLLVVLPSAPPPGPFTLRFEIDGNFLVRPSGSSFWQLFPGSFPVPFERNANHYTLSTTVKVPKPYIAFAPGVTVERSEQGELNIVRTKLDQPTTFPVIHAGKYSVEEETRKALTVRVATYAGKNKQAAKQLTDLTYAIVSFYETFLGPFPYSEFNIIQIDTWGYGQAPPGMMFITNEAFSPLSGDLNQHFSQGINHRFAHEIAHQYWGHAVSWPSEEEQWLSESFAEYSAAFFLKKLKGDSSYTQLVNSWRANARQASPSSSIALANRINLPEDPESEFSMRRWLIYDKGAYLLYTLHKELGDEVFLTFLKSFQSSFRWKMGATKHVAGLLKAITKKDYSQFIDHYYWSTEMPK